MMSASSNPLQPAGSGHPGPLGSGVVALDIGSCGVRAAVRVGGAFLPVLLSETGLVPSTLITLRETDRAVDFPALMDRIGEDSAVPIADLTEKPHLFLKKLLTQLRAPLEAWWGPAASLALVISGFATDLQRSLIQKAARAAGYPANSLVNKTTALAVHALRRNRPGQYMALVLGYSGAEASVVQLEGKQLRALSYSLEPWVSGGMWDRLMLGFAADLAHALGKELPTGLYDRGDWLLIRAQMELVRRQLDIHKSVIWPVPAALYEGAAMEFTFSREQRDQVLGLTLDRLDALVDRCCHEAGTGKTKLQGCVATGGLIFQRPVRDRLFATFGNISVRLFPHDSQSLGACQLVTQEMGPDPREVPPSAQESSVSLRLPRVEKGTLGALEQRDIFSTFIEQVRGLAAAGRRAEARAELGRLRDYVKAIELSIEEPEVALRNISATPAIPSVLTAGQPLQEPPKPPNGKRRQAGTRRGIEPLRIQEVRRWQDLSRDDRSPPPRRHQAPPQPGGIRG
jgi:hypothetical protein